MKLPAGMPKAKRLSAQIKRLTPVWKGTRQRTEELQK
jgi:hypothetical protein